MAHFATEFKYAKDVSENCLKVTLFLAHHHFCIIIFSLNYVSKCELYIPMCKRSVQVHNKAIFAFCMVPLFKLGTTFFESHGSHVCAKNILQFTF